MFFFFENWKLYGDNNRTFNALEVANELEAIVEGFKARHPDFIGLKVIYTKPNQGTVDEMAQHLITFKQLQLVNIYRKILYKNF